MRWTDVTVRQMKADPNKRLEVPAPNKPSLYLVIQPTGARSWCVRYRFSGKPRKLTLGSFPKVSLAMAYDATDKAASALAHGIDPAAAAAKRAGDDGDTSVAAHVVKYRERHVVKLRKGTQGYVNRELDRMLTKWPGRSLASIRKEDINTLIADAAARGSSAENTSWAVIKGFFSWCEEQLTDYTSPARTIGRPNKATERDRVLTDDELRAIWNACPDNAAGRLCKTLMLTGARRDEMASLLRTEIKADAIVLAKERTKTNERHEIALTPLMRSVLAETKGNGKYALTGTDYPVSKSSRIKEAIETPDLAEWHFHDLRRTFATGLARKPFSVPLPVIEKALNHKMQGVMKVYQRHDFLEERCEALLAWSAHIEKLVTPPMRKAA
jgi:integrase